MQPSGSVLQTWPGAHGSYSQRVLALYMTSGHTAQKQTPSRHHKSRTVEAKAKECTKIDTQLWVVTSHREEPFNSISRQSRKWRSKKPEDKQLRHSDSCQTRKKKIKPQNWVWLVPGEATAVSQVPQALSSVMVSTSSLVTPQMAAFVL